MLILQPSVGGMSKVEVELLAQACTRSFSGRSIHACRYFSSHCVLEHPENKIRLCLYVISTEGSQVESQVDFAKDELTLCTVSVVTGSTVF